MSKNTKAKKPDNAKGGKSEIVDAVMRMRKGGASIKDIAKKLHIGDRRVSAIISGASDTKPAKCKCQGGGCKCKPAEGLLELKEQFKEMIETAKLGLKVVEHRIAGKSIKAIAKELDLNEVWLSVLFQV